MTRRDVSRIHRWTYSKKRGGTDGIIPADAAADLLSEAVERGIPLTPAHFFPAYKADVIGNGRVQPLRANPAKTDSSKQVRA